MLVFFSWRKLSERVLNSLFSLEYENEPQRGYCIIRFAHEGNWKLREWEFDFPNQILLSIDCLLYNQCELGSCVQSKEVLQTQVSVPLSSCKIKASESVGVCFNS